MTKHLKDNPTPPKVHFIKKHGRIIPIVGGKYSSKAHRALKSSVKHMTKEIEDSTAGKRYVTGYGTSQRVFSRKSTFPQYFRDMGFKTKKEWLDAVKRGKGSKYEAIVDKASEDIDFKIATRQVFDNRLVSFRNIDGQVVPIRSRNKAQFDKYNSKAFLKLKKKDRKFYNKYITGTEVPF